MAHFIGWGALSLVAYPSAPGMLTEVAATGQHRVKWDPGQAQTYDSS